MFEMDKPMTFEEVFKDAYDYWIDDANIHRYEGAKGLAGQVWQHQQAKVEELKKTNRKLEIYMLEIQQNMADAKELQKRVDKALELCKKGGALSACLAFRVEQALKGEG